MIEVIIFSNSSAVKTCGPYRIATELRKNDISCQIVDHLAEFTVDEIIEILKKTISPITKVVGLSSTFISVGWALKMSPTERRGKSDVLELSKVIIETTKQINPDIKIIVGGANSFRYLHTIQFDAVFQGFSDLAIVDYVKNLPSTKSVFPVVINGDDFNKNFEFNKSQIVYADTDHIRHGEVVTLEISRGCVFNCKFCSYPLIGKKKNDYIKEKDSLKEELLRNYYEHGITSYALSDDTHNENTLKVQMLAEIAQSLPFKLEYSTYLRIDLLRSHPEQYAMLNDAGLKGAVFGIESLHTPSTKAIGKGMSSEKIIEELYTFKEKLPNVLVRAGFIVGLPFETKDSIEKWAEMIQEESFPIHSYQFFPMTIDRDESKFYRSEFDLHPEKYYSWEDDGIWNNGDFNLVWAREFAHRYHTLKDSKFRRVGGFMYSSFTNLGYKSEDMWKSLDEIRDSGQRYNEFISAYKKNFLD
jgi:radical SAM superfamily enzyme YgiQ (UPF0313 family)